MTSDEAKTQLIADQISRGLTQIDKVRFEADFDAAVVKLGSADAAYAACVVTLDGVLASLRLGGR